MFALLLAWVAMNVTTTGAATGNSHHKAAIAAPRDWKNVTGTKQVRATLVRVDGDKLWLRRTDGKLAKTTVSQLSPEDRQYVPGQHAQSSIHSAVAKSLLSTTQVVGAIGEQVQSMVALPRWTTSVQSERQVRLVPAAVMYVRISRDFLDDYVQRNVDRTKPVRDYILGARISGESNTRGKTSLELLPSKGQLLGKLTFEGTVHAATRGYKGPVVLHQISDTTFRSSKTISMDENGLRVSSATTEAPTKLKTVGIDTSLPRLRGRVATRIAWKRVGEAHGQAESITSQHTAANISEDFDERTNQSVAQVQAMLKSTLASWNGDDDVVRTEMRFRSSAKCIEVAMMRREASKEERKLRPPLVSGNPDVAVRVHRAALAKAMEDPKLRDEVAPMFIKVMNTRFGQNSTSIGAPKTAADASKLNVDLDWLAMDFMDTAG